MSGADRATVPVARLALTGLPVSCPHCATVAAEWPLIVHGLVIKAACPACWTAVLPVVAVAAQS